MNLICQFWQIKKKLSKQISADNSQKKMGVPFNNLKLVLTN